MLVYLYQIPALNYYSKTIEGHRKYSLNFYATYNSYIHKTIEEKYHETFEFLKFEEECVEVFNVEPIVAYNTHKSVGDMLAY